MSEPTPLRFGAFDLDPACGELRKNGDLVKLPPQPFKVLILLARRSGEAVTRSEIREQIWSEDTFVDFDQGLNFCIRQIREALDDDAEAPRFIETLPRRGYRFLMPIESPDSAVAARLTRLMVLPFRMLLRRVVAGGFVCFPAMNCDPWLDPLRPPHLHGWRETACSGSPLRQRCTPGAVVSAIVETLVAEPLRDGQ